MKRNRFILTLTAIVALCLALTGCGGGAGGGDPTKTFLGTWDLAKAPDLAEEDIELMKAFGVYCFIDLQEDDKAELNLMGEPLEGTWEAESATECSITFEGDTVTATLDDDLLSLEIDGDELAFKKLSDEDAAKLKEESENALAGSMGAEEEGSMGAEEDGEIVEEINQQLVSDDLCTIEIINKTTDWAGDSGYTLKITNNSDTTFTVSAVWDTFSVNGTMSDPALSETIKPGANAEAFMWFDQDVAPDIDSLVSVEGEIEIYNSDTYETIATYAFTA